MSLEELGITQEEIDEALHESARYGEIDSLKELCDAEDTGPYVQYDCLDSESRSTALHKAAANGHLETVVYLCDKGSKYLLNDNGVGPITWAIMNGQVDIVKYLIGKFPEQIDVLAMPTNGGRSPLANAYDSGNEEIVSLMLMHPSAKKLETMYKDIGDINDEVEDETKDNDVDQVADSLEETTL